MAWDIHGLFLRHAKGIRRSLRLRGFDAETAADLTQDAFVRTMVAPVDGNAPDYLMRAYLYRVARNLGINHVKRQALIGTLPLDDPRAQSVHAREPDAESIVITREHLRLVHAILRALPERQRRAFLLHRIENMPIARIADELGLSSTRTWELVRDAYRQIVLQTGGV